MLKHKLLLLGALLTFNVSADFYDPQNTFLKRDLPNGAYNGTTALNNYLNAVVTQSYTGETPATFTLNKWKQLNGFNSTNTLNAQFFNSGDLGLGRDMNCVAQPQLESTRGTGAMACYVSNYGKIGGGAAHAFAELARSKLSSNPSKEFATVAMEYRPSATRNKVRFFVFDSQSNGGKLVTGLKIVLDNSNGQEQPGLCLACHGGKLTNPNDANLINITGAHFLPFDPFSFEFETPEKREAARTTITQMNKLVHKAEKATYGQTSALASDKQIWQYLEGSYTPSITDTAPVMVDTFTPAPFNNSDADRNLYHTVTKQFCRSCHMSSEVVLSPSLMFPTCVDGDMPHAEVNAANLRRHMEFVAYDMERYAGNSNCYKMPHLIDFQTALVPNTMWFEKTFINLNNIPMEVLLSGGELSSVNGLFKQQHVTVDPIIGVNNQRSVLKSNQIETRIGFNVSKFDDISRTPKINKVELLFNYSGDGNKGFPMLLMDQTSVSRGIRGLTPGNPGISETNGTNDKFLKFSEDVSSLNVNHIQFAFATNLLTPNLGQHQIPVSLEADDISVSYDTKIPNALYEDFENILKSPPSNAVSIRTRLADCDAPAPTASVGNRIKVDSDSGRYSYATNPGLCKGDTIDINIASISNALLIKPSGVAGQLMFDFKISDKATIEGRDILGIARQQGTLVLQNGSYNGRVKLALGSAENYTLRFVMQDDSGRNGKPIRGVAIDNIRFVPSI